MKTFREFLRGFKPKYHLARNRKLGLRTQAQTSPEQGEIILYEGYLRRMRQIGETNFNLDVVDLQAYPPAKRLYSHLVKYPQEVIPVMDRVVKDRILGVADRDQHEGVEGIIGAEGDAEIAEIMGKVYKLRPFRLTTINMRELNPSDPDKLVRIKDLVQPQSYSKVAFLPLPNLFAHPPDFPDLNRPRQDRGT